MNYLQLFEKYTKFKFMVDDYVKVLPGAGPRVDMENREGMVYQISGGRKKPQGWAGDVNVYSLKQAYEPYEELENWEFQENMLRDLTKEEKEELELYIATKKYNV